MTGTLLATFRWRTGSARNSDTPSTLLRTIRAHGLAMEVGLDVTSFRDFRSAWYTYCARTRSKSSLWLTVDDGPATGDPESDSPSNVRMQRAALRAAR